MKKIPATVLVLALPLISVACEQDASDTDINEPRLNGDAVPEDYEARAPDSLTVFLNVDDHPTIVRVCIDGVAFRTLSTTHSGLASPAVDRVPEWDALCPVRGDS